ncbi:unnamed protein product [Lactuca saligna]|uniref:Uncharacterized protein n=1 Tax=Lactuca saligna TaxID=75948 RepID=A0AA36EG61_LACSI|nr:unnamed protein product [Lactuca saligna]
MGAISSTHASSTTTSSNQSILPTSSTQSSVPTSIQSSTPASTTSSVPTSITNCSKLVKENVGVQHQEYLLGSTGLDERLYIGVRDKELFTSGPCSSIIYKSFGERVDLNGYSWETLSDETKLLYWDEFHKKCYWDDAKTSAQEEIRTKQKNRCRGVADGQTLSTHTGGSASHSKIASDLNHDGVTFLIDKAKKIHDGFMERCDRLEAIGEEIDDDKIFYDVVGGHDRKKRLYGFGSYGKRIRSSKKSSEMHREQYEDNNAETKVEIENLKTRHNANNMRIFNKNMRMFNKNMRMLRNLLWTK